MAERPNILLIMADQMRADCLGCTGAGAAHTPNLDALARQGILFSSAYSSTPSCTPARAGLLTGWSPWRHGMLGYGRIAGRYANEMPRMLADAGYSTTAIGKLHYFPQRHTHGFQTALLDESGRVETPGFVSDYRQWFKREAPDLDPDATGLGWNDFDARTYALPERLHPTQWTGDRAVERLSEVDESRPFFLKVSFARPHSPYDPPERLARRFDGAAVPAAAVGAWAEKFAHRGEKPRSDAWCGDLGAEQVRESRRAYYAGVAFIDEQVGRILEALRSRKLLERTLIVFTADHGDMLGDHNLWRKTYPYEGSARIPMILRWPEGMVRARRGLKSGKPVELRDVLPTFVDAAGLRAGPHTFDGQTLLDLVRRRDAPWRETLDLEHCQCYVKENDWNALTDGRMKYVWWAYTGQEQLFDLRADPHELRDLAREPARAGELAEWRGRMVRHLTPRGDRFARDGRPVVRTKSVLYSPNFPAGDKP